MHQPIIRAFALRASASLIRRKKTIATAVVASVALAYFLMHLPQAIEYRISRGPVRERAEAARRLGLTYQAVVRAPAQAVDKPVEWMITHPDSKVWFADDDHNQPVLWDGEPAEMNEGRMSRGATVVAIVVQVLPQGVVLRVIE